MSPVVRIDDEVMEALKKRAIEWGLVFEPPNATLRRVLGLDKASSDTAPPASTLTPRFSSLSTPVTLQKILEVTRHCRENHLSRTEATRLVARARKIASPTVADAYTRRLGLKSRQFDDLLRQPDLLKKRLKERFPKHHALIDDNLKA